MNFEILTLFPEMFEGFLNHSIIGIAREKGIINVNCTDIRDFSDNKHRRVDDTPYGGGYGMILQCRPAVDCLRSVKKRLEGTVHTVYLSPQGNVFNHGKAKELAEFDNVILLCGHYEGIDERILELEVDEEISIGDYVLTGGELPAAVIVDSVSRLKEGVLKDASCYNEESIAGGLLEYPQYTKPREFEGLCVPEVLLNGNQAEIDKWRTARAFERTAHKRPDMLERLKGDDVF